MKKKLSSPSFVFDDRQTVAFNNFEDIGGRKDIYEFIHCQSEECYWHPDWEYFPINSKTKLYCKSIVKIALLAARS